MKNAHRSTPRYLVYCGKPGCTNRYDDVIGGKNAFGGHGATCIPCLYAEQMVEHDQTIEQVEAVPQLMQMFTDLLAKTGWNWEDVKASHARMAGGKRVAQ